MEKTEKSILKKQVSLNQILPIVYVTISILWGIPSILYLAKNKTIFYFIGLFSYIFFNPNTKVISYIDTALYLLLVFSLFTTYIYILKRSKYIFNNKKKMFAFILIIGILFCFIIPSTSLDVYSYIGNGWVDSNYHKNPYYTTVQEILNNNSDEMLRKVALCWRTETVVYGPAWSLICKVLTKISFGNITNALYIFKIANLIVFLSCSFLVQKITRKRFFTLLFALNPFILFEFLANAHNDIYLVFLILLAIYFIKNKKNVIASVACIAIATALKYLSILLLPFILAYALRNEDIKNKIMKIIVYVIEFITIIASFYLIYVKDLKVLSGIFIQQNKYGRSIALALWYLLNGDEKAMNIVKIASLSIFAFCYISIVYKMLFSKNTEKISFIKTMRIYQIFLLIFTFILITNFNAWYLIWLFPTIMWQKSKNIQDTLSLSLGVMLSYAISYATKIDNETVGIQYLVIMFIPLIARRIIKFLKIKRNNDKGVENVI